MKEFSIGERAIYVKPGPNFNKIVTVVGPLKLYNLTDTFTGEKEMAVLAYACDSSDVVHGPHASELSGWVAKPEYLRKLDGDDGREVDSWENCVWKPKELTV